MVETLETKKKCINTSHNLRNKKSMIINIWYISFQFSVCCIFRNAHINTAESCFLPPAFAVFIFFT